ncbi:hypothetical protein GCM10012320_26110 [Sinomonas cellulolyticus]|nr:hypothetical protein GCM10012320_26110 [Sinomonas sp. KCTC 49339]
MAARVPIEGSGYGPIARRPDCVRYIVAMSTWGEGMGDDPDMDYGSKTDVSARDFGASRPTLYVGTS